MNRAQKVHYVTYASLRKYVEISTGIVYHWACYNVNYNVEWYSDFETLHRRTVSWMHTYTHTQDGEGPGDAE